MRCIPSRSRTSITRLPSAKMSLSLNWFPHNSSWSVPQPSPLVKSSHWGSQEGFLRKSLRKASAFLIPSWHSTPTSFAWFVAAPPVSACFVLLTGQTVTQVALSPFSEQGPQLLKETAVSKCDAETVWCYPHTFVKTFHKPSQLEVGLICPRAEVKFFVMASVSRA